MKRHWSGQSCDRQGAIPEVGGLHTNAEAAASLSEDCVQASGDIALGCSDVSVLVGGGDPRAEPDIIKSNRRLIADPKVPAKARILRQKCHLRQNSVNCDKCDNLHQNSTICIKTALFA